MIVTIDHLQIAAPPDCEAEARRFYGGLLRMSEIEKPEPLRSRGGCWFQCGDRQLHIGVEKDFRPSLKAHPAFLVSDLNRLREVLGEVTEDDSLPGIERFYATDPWGNRLEFLQAR